MKNIDETLEHHGTVKEFPPREEAKANGGDTHALVVIDAKDFIATARQFVARHYTLRQQRVLHFQGDAFFGWVGTHYVEVAAADLHAQLYNFLAAASVQTRKGIVPFKPNRAAVAETLDALKVVANLSAAVSAPAWLRDPAPHPATEIIVCANGLLHLKTGNISPATPDFFSVNALAFAYDAAAPKPEAFLRFLDDLFGADAEAVATLQEMLGYFLTSDTRQQKAFLITGPKRSGKGTLGRLTTALLGRANVVNPTLSGLSTNFGLSPLVGKRLAIISDARLGGRTDHQIVIERLLSITGEDGQTIDRKYLAAWSGQLQTRFLILTNELPRLSDTSGALASRFIVLALTRSFLGREDVLLTERLLCELPGILNWAIAGWHRLTARGHFIQPASSVESIRQLEELASPVGAFLAERCTTGPGLTAPVLSVFEAWKSWCDVQGHRRPGTAQVFGRDLRAVLPSIKIVQPRIDGARYRVYEGLALKGGDDER